MALLRHCPTLADRPRVGAWCDFLLTLIHQMSKCSNLNLCSQWRKGGSLVALGSTLRIKTSSKVFTSGYRGLSECTCRIRFHASCTFRCRTTPKDVIGDARKMDSLPDNLFDGVFDKGIVTSGRRTQHHHKIFDGRIVSRTKYIRFLFNAWLPTKLYHVSNAKQILLSGSRHSHNGTVDQAQSACLFSEMFPKG